MLLLDENSQRVINGFDEAENDVTPVFWPLKSPDFNKSEYLREIFGPTPDREHLFTFIPPADFQRLPPVVFPLICHFVSIQTVSAGSVWRIVSNTT